MLPVLVSRLVPMAGPAAQSRRDDAHHYAPGRSPTKFDTARAYHACMLYEN